MEINRLNLSHLHNEEWFGVFVDLFAEVPKYGAENLGIADLIARLLPLYNTADKLLLTLQKSPFTTKMVKADKDRDAAFRSLTDAVKAALGLPNEADRDAADRLRILLTSYRKSVLSSSYTEESNALYNLMEDIDGKYATDVTLLGLGKWVNNLREAEQKFQSYRAERTQEDIAKPVEELRKVRRQMDALYHSIINVLYASLMADGLGGDVAIDPESLKDGVYESNVPSEQRGNIVYNFVIAWNRILKKYENLLATRAGRRAKEKEQQPDAPDAPEESPES